MSVESYTSENDRQEFQGLSEVTTTLLDKKNKEYTDLGYLLLGLNKDKINLLLQQFDTHNMGVNWKYFSVLEPKQITEIMPLLKEFANPSVYGNEAAPIAKEITQKLYILCG